MLLASAWKAFGHDVFYFIASKMKHFFSCENKGKQAF